MVPRWQKSPKWLNLRIKDLGYDHGHQVIVPGVIWKGFISLECMPNMKSLSSYGSEVKYFFKKRQKIKDRQAKNWMPPKFNSRNRQMNYRKTCHNGHSR